jgi:hypothetical protein
MTSQKMMKGRLKKMENRPGTIENIVEYLALGVTIRANGQMQCRIWLAAHLIRLAAWLLGASIRFENEGTEQ